MSTWAGACQYGRTMSTWRFTMSTLRLVLAWQKSMSTYPVMLASPERCYHGVSGFAKYSRCRGGRLETFPSQDGQSASQIGHLESISGRLKTSNASQ
eukprot:1664864-Prymnesium_polylepis.1